MKRLITACALLLASVLPAQAQLTTMPIPLAQWFDNTGAVLNDGGLCVFRAGTSTLATTYTTAAGTVANANPVIFAASGRPQSNGVFLTPGQSYKFVLKDFTGVVSKTCIPDTGVTVWTVDNIETVPGSAANVDVLAVAGESIAAGQVVYMSDGSGGRAQGQWFLADADLTYAGALPLVGIAPNAIASSASGSVRIQGRITDLSLLTTGADYYVSTTAGAMTATAPGYARQIGQADSASSIVIDPNPRSSPITPEIPCGRLTLTANTPVTTSDVTAATSVFFSPYGGCNKISLYDGSRWPQRTFAEVSIAVPATTNTMYDVFGYDNAGTFTLELTAWTNDTTRATALTTQNAVYVKTGALTRLYLGSFRTTGVSGQTEDSAAKRYVWNYYNRVVRPLAGSFVTGTYNYTTDTYRQFNATTTVQLDIVVGVAEDALEATAINWAYNGGSSVTVQIGIGEDSTSAAVAGVMGGASQVGPLQPLTVTIRRIPAVGRHFYAALERSGAAGTTAWGPNANAMAAGGNAGIVGLWKS